MEDAEDIKLKLQELRSANRLLSMENRKLQSDYDNTTSALNQLKDNFERDQSEREAEKEKIQKEIANNSAQLQSQRKEKRRQLLTEIRQLTTSNHALSKEIEELQSELKRYQEVKFGHSPRQNKSKITSKSSPIH